MTESGAKPVQKVLAPCSAIPLAAGFGDLDRREHGEPRRPAGFPHGLSCGPHLCSGQGTPRVVRSESWLLPLLGDGLRSRHGEGPGSL